jgi:hypothetical protein
MIPPEFQERRNNCGMRCMYGSPCKYCQTIAHLANPDIIKPIKERVEENV